MPYMTFGQSILKNPFRTMESAGFGGLGETRLELQNRAAELEKALRAGDVGKYEEYKAAMRALGLLPIPLEKLHPQMASSAAIPSSDSSSSDADMAAKRAEADRRIAAAKEAEARKQKDREAMRLVIAKQAAAARAAAAAHSAAAKTASMVSAAGSKVGAAVARVIQPARPVTVISRQ